MRSELADAVQILPSLTQRSQVRIRSHPVSATGQRIRPLADERQANRVNIAIFIAGVLSLLSSREMGLLSENNAAGRMVSLTFRVSTPERYSFPSCTDCAGAKARERGSSTERRKP